MHERSILQVLKFFTFFKIYVLFIFTITITLNPGSVNFDPQANAVKICGPPILFQPKVYILKNIKIKDFVIKTYI